MSNSDKQKVNLYDWELDVCEGKYRLSGMMEYHPEEGRNVRLFSFSGFSDMSFISVNDDILQVGTSDTIYFCPLKYMSVQPYMGMVDEHAQDMSHVADESDDPVKKIISVCGKLRMKNGRGKTEPIQVEEDDFFKHITMLQKTGKEELKRREEEDDQRMLDIIEKYEDSVYLELINTAGAEKLSYHIGEQSGIIRAKYHCGDYKNSVLFLSYMGDVDFRYFPELWGDSFDTYAWSEKIKQALVKNGRDYNVRFNKTEIRPGEIKKFKREDCC